MIETIQWTGRAVKIVDQTCLPSKVEYRECTSVEELAEAIEKLRIRGAPAIGVAAAFGVVLAADEIRASTRQEFVTALEARLARLAGTRPTAVNLSWALDRMRRVIASWTSESVAEVRKRLLEEAVRIREEDRQICRTMGLNGAELLEDGMTVLTHCHTGGLATSDYGTALGVIYAAKEQGKTIRVFADETRPLLQGARLTAWELAQYGIDVTLICDSTAAWVMNRGFIDCVLVGADRIAMNGDVANKIGTFGVALAAKEHGIPFYVVAPTSTIDMTLASGEEIPIEERPAEEVTCVAGQRVAPESIKVYNPAFDVTPSRYVSAIVSEKGIAREPFEAAFRQWSSM